ncbi:MAG: 50S ribosomal protein L24 [Patescibacteria group bacterium]
MIRKGDNVKVIAGKDRGKTGKVMQAFPDLGKIVVEGVNQASKHLRTQKRGEKGQKVTYSSPLSATNVQVICPKCSQPTRLGTKVLAEGGKDKKARLCKKCKEVI